MQHFTGDEPSSDATADDANRSPDAGVTLSRPSDSRPSDAAVVELLRDHHGAEPTDLEALGGRVCSAAFGYRGGVGGVVLRGSGGRGGGGDDGLGGR
jgi:hypothetical protein